MKKFFEKRLLACLVTLLTLTLVSCERTNSFDIADYTLTVNVQEGSYSDEGVVSYPQLTVLVEGPGANLWNMTVTSADGDSFSFLARTGEPEKIELALEAFDKGETALELTVTARENTHQELLGNRQITAEMLPDGLTKIRFTVKESEKTKVVVTDLNSLKSVGFNVLATVTDDNQEEHKAWTYEAHYMWEDEEGYFIYDKWWPAIDPHYHFYASNASIAEGTDGCTVAVQTNSDVVCAYKENPTYNAPTQLDFEHIFARLGTIRISAVFGYTLDAISLSFTPKSSGTYNLRSKQWTNTSDGTLIENLTNNNEPYDNIWCVPGTYQFSITYTISKGDYTKQFNKTGTVTLEAGKINNIKCNTLEGDEEPIEFTVTLADWTSSDKTMVVS